MARSVRDWRGQHRQGAGEPWLGTARGGQASRGEVTARQGEVRQGMARRGASGVGLGEAW